MVRQKKKRVRAPDSVEDCALFVRMLFRVLGQANKGFRLESIEGEGNGIGGRVWREDNAVNT
jgi:hypothetical protein